MKTNAPNPIDQLLDAALPHVVFDGWSDACFDLAVRDSDVNPVVARGLCPRGALDLAVAFHQRGDRAMIAAYEAHDKNDLKIREKVTLAVRLRLEHMANCKEEVRRATTLFALPHNMATGASLIWGTADAIWALLGDTAQDGNWYSKRAILSAVYTSTVLYWLGDDSADHTATWAFLDRRIGNVMQFEKTKATMPFANTLAQIMGKIKAPKPDQRASWPGHVAPK